MPELPIALRRYLEVSRQPAGSAFHTSQVSISFGEVVDGDALKSAWETVATAHDALRTTFATDGSPVVATSPEFTWQAFDWQSAPPEDLGTEWQRLQQTDAAAPIATDAAPPCRITFIRLPNGGGHALWSFHGALLDQLSASAALHQWLHAYDCLRSGAEAPQFEAIPAETSAGGDEWKDAFKDFVPPRPLIVLPLPESGTTGGTRRSVSHTFERPERTAFAMAATAMDADLRSLFGAAWAFVIARATSSDDALLLENERMDGGIGRIENLVLRRRCVESVEMAGDLVRDFAKKIPGPTDLQAAAQVLGITTQEIEPATAFFYRDHTLNDLLQLGMPRWMAADTQLFQLTVPPITLRVIATDRPEVALDYDPAFLSDTAAKLLFDLFLATLDAFAADAALILHDYALPAPPAIVDGGEAPATFRSLVPQCIH
ncbi:MAG: condensation domain-containing protein, partial [Chthoniobacterales bacterium]